MMLAGLLTDEQKEKNVEFESTFVKRASTVF
jgi:hypothetical protein